MKSFSSWLACAAMVKHWAGVPLLKSPLFWLQLEAVMPPVMHLAAQRTVRSLRRLIFAAISWSGLLCALYYCFFSRAFRREQQAVTAGFLEQLSRRDQEQLYFGLRRNIHRIEKGLLMRPRKAIFALEYIQDTVDSYIELCRGTRLPELQWATDVLKLYFSCVGSHPIIDAAQEKFASAAIESTEDKVPYKRIEERPAVGYDELLSLARHRKSVRWFLQQPVPHELIDQAIQVAALAPSACNRQPFVYRFYDDPQLLSALARLPHGTIGFADNIPMLCTVVGDLSAYMFERDRHGIYIDAALSIMSFMHALETLGLASCPINWPDIERLERQAGQALGLKRYERIIMFLAVGYPHPEGLVAYSEKKSVAQLRRFN